MAEKVYDSERYLENGKLDPFHPDNLRLTDEDIAQMNRKKRCKGDMVNKPPHYTAHPSGIECIEVTEHMSFNVGNAVKYLWRCDLKGKPLEDLKKARYYVDREIKRRTGEAEG